MGLIQKNNFLNDYSVALDPQFDMERRVLEFGVWEPHVVALLGLLIDDGDVCIDIGANIGLHSLAMAKASGSTGKTLAFEPGDQSFARLTQNVSLNPTLRQQIVCEKLCVSDKPGTLKLFIGGDGSNAYVAENFNPNLWNKGGPEDFQLCDVTTIDEHLKGEKVDFIKVDVEGMEHAVFKGALNTIHKHKPLIIFETLASDFGAEKVQLSEDILRQNGYLLFGFLLRDERLIPVSYPALHADTLAIHSSKIDQILPKLDGVLAPFSTFALKPANRVSDEPLFEALLSKGEHLNVLLRLLSNPLPTSLFANANPLEGKLGLTTETFPNRNDVWNCTLEMLDPDSMSCKGTVSVGEQRIEVIGQRTRNYGSIF